MHLFNPELFGFDIHLVSDDAAEQNPSNYDKVRWVVLGEQKMGTFWRAPTLGAKQKLPDSAFVK